MHTGSWIEISRSALEHNHRFLRRHLAPARIAWVVKGNAYGHGIERVVPLAEDAGADYFAVFSAREAQRVLDTATRHPRVMIMGQIEDDELAWAVERGVECYVFDPERLVHFLDAARAIGRPARLHLEVETGMNRTGLTRPQLRDALRHLEAERRHAELVGLCTHYAGAESVSNYLRVQRQFKAFERYHKRLDDAGWSFEFRHTACSAAAMRYPRSRMDLVRIGILQYGFFPSREVYIEYRQKHKATEDPLRRLIAWKCRVMDVKTVKAGEFVGYGTSYLANDTMRVASVPVGYAQGYARGLSNVGRVLVRGQRVPVVGTVNMNMMMIDVSGVAGVERGDEVVLIGRQGDQEISVASFGEFSDLLNYELLTRLPEDIPRRVVA
jgi:alanine racemase